MRIVTVHDEILLYAECRRLYETDAHTDLHAAERYLAAISDIDAALHYIDSHKNAWQTLDAATEKQVLETLDKLTREGEEFARSQKERKQQ